MEFMVTFGQRHRREPHPTFAEAHPDGWLTVEADTYEQARATVEGWLGLQWSGLYEACDFDASYYPRGELHRIRVTLDGRVARHDARSSVGPPGTNAPAGLAAAPLR